jgi:hypothetical protein
MKKTILGWLYRKWWGLAVAYPIAVFLTYLLVWRVVQPFSIPPQINDLPTMMKSRVFLHIWISVTVGGFIVLFVELLWRRMIWLRKVEQQFFVKSYPRSQSAPFFAEIETLIPAAKNILLVGAGINLIWEKHIIDIIIQRVKAKEAKVTICMANPYSPHMESRYIEEEMRNENPSVGRDGMRKNVRALVHKIVEAGNPDGLSYSLFENYPTLATLIIDNNIFVYPYAYHVLGNVSPILHFVNDGSETAQFFIDNAKRIVEYSVPAKDVVYARENREYYSEGWIAAAVYIIPKSDTPLFKLGSEFLGYDIRQARLISVGETGVPDIRQYIGEAEIYGFHVTVADALFFAAQSGVDRVEAELKFLAEEFAPFRLEKMRVIETFRDSGDIVLACEDESGTLEALHHELVMRMYRTSISSTYLARRTKKQVPPTKQRRSRLMLERYGMPHVLNGYKPHFTVCSNAPADPKEKARILSLIEDSAHKFRALDPIEISEICLVTKTSRDPRWKIAKVFSLARR